MTAKLLFLFGTLRYPALLEAVIGDASHVTSEPASARDFAVRSVAEGPFPAIVRESGALAQGVLVQGLTDKDIGHLDYYESAFGYTRQPVELTDGTHTLAYIPEPGLWTTSGPWSLEAWVRDWGPLSVLAAREVMGYQGDRPPQEIAAIFPMIRARAWSRLNAARSRHGASTLHGAVDVQRWHRAYAQYFALDEYELRHERFDGSMTETVRRAVFLSPDAALVLPYDPRRDRVMVVEQMRMGPLARGDDTMWQLEPIAGRLDPGEAPEAAARREALEETGLMLGALHPVAETYCSPGNSSEFFYCYVGIAELPDGVAGVGGVASEHEDIRAHLLSFDALMTLCDDRRAANAPLVLSAYWLSRHRERLRAAS
ncbi:NUDIX domain-containing protein [Roseobacter sp. YSTF-M11]|uniref:ADP-ribose pyrophosphatase n=1 Tax=Roseobacter insulae TaxID=2859783 RepID=A0A9X1FUI5_9RHOB|nr:NUDIX domain-containing protein [Roseobacter insulae]MBW4708170.1 NUDIX domain-containing protein [Roseobacter insulae]